MVKTKKTVSTHKPLNLNCSAKKPKSLMCGSFNVQPTKENNYHFNSVFGSPNQKIGNFTGQKKLGDFNA